MVRLEDRINLNQIFEISKREKSPGTKKNDFKGHKRFYALKH